MSDAKRAARRALAARRQALSADTRELFDAALTHRLLAYLTEHGARRIAAYHPLATEPGGDHLIPALAAATDQLYLPISGPAGRLDWAYFDPKTELRVGRHGIQEPTGPLVSTAEIISCDLIIVPTLGLNRQGIRLGKGGGYYDRFLSLPSHPAAVTLIYPSDLEEDFPVEAHDQPVTAAVTPSEILSFSP